MPAPIFGTYYVTQGYGLTDYAKSASGRAAYKNFPGGMHPGIDYGTKGLSLPAISTCKGKVVSAAMNGGWGNLVEVEGADGWRRMYAHLKEIKVKVGQTVQVGDILGSIGTTGSSTGIHLHYGHRRWKLIVWEYRDPTSEVSGVNQVPTMEYKPGLIKANDAALPGIFFYNGKARFQLPNMETMAILFPNKVCSLIDPGDFAKIPEGDQFPDLKV